MKKLKIFAVAIMLAFLVSGNYNVKADETITTPNKLIVFKINHNSYYTQDIGSTEVKTVKMDTAPFIKDSRTFVPVRFLGNALGVSDSNIAWDNSARKAVLQGRSKLTLTIGSETMQKNNENIVMDVAPLIANPGRTMLPARYVAEGLGFKVEWDAEKQLVIAYPEGQPRPDIEAILKEINKDAPKEPTKVTIDCTKITGKYETIDRFPEFGMMIWSTAVKFYSRDGNNYRYVCTNHPELNKAMMAGYGETTKKETDLSAGCCGEFTIANGKGYSIKIEKGMTLCYDIYNEAGVKIYEMTFKM